MISRRHIRIKVMQSLYSFFLSSNNEIKFFEKQMIQDIKSLADLHIIIISFIIEINIYAEDFLEDNKSKHLPSLEDLDPNKKFVNNRFISVLRNNDLLAKKISRISSIWRKGDLDIIRKMFVEIIKSDEYKNYLDCKEDSFYEDKKFVQILLSKFILDNEIFHHILQERSIFWIDDLPFVSVFLRNQINLINQDEENHILIEVFKNLDDKRFAIDLFRKTIIHANNFEGLIEAKAKNWELERIANMDILLIKMALTEIIEFEEIPVRVTFNEYIEISKYYSTENSKVFINGVLDKIVSEFTREGKVNKTGRGLV